jgi:cold-inducible RNA-binding protein
MTNKLYIGNISYDASQEDLSALFSEVGLVSAIRVIIDRESGRSRGFGFVEMANRIQSKEVIDRFNGYNLLGRTLVVRFAHDNRELNRRARRAGIDHYPYIQKPIEERIQKMQERFDPWRYSVSHSLE